MHLPYLDNFAEQMNAAAMELMLTSQNLMFTKNVWKDISESQTKEIKWYLPQKKSVTCNYSIRYRVIQSQAMNCNSSKMHC